MSGTPQAEVKWQEDCSDRARASSQRGWSTFTIESKAMLLVLMTLWSAILEKQKPALLIISSFFSQPRKFPVEEIGARQESKLH